MTLKKNNKFHFSDLKDEMAHKELNDETLKFAMNLAANTFAFDLVSVDAITPEQKLGNGLKTPKVTRKPYMNGIYVITTIYDDSDFGVNSYEYGEEYEKCKAAFIARSGVHDVWWGGERYDFDDISGERKITQDDVDFINRKMGTKYTLSYFEKGAGVYLPEGEEGGYALVFKNGNVLINDNRMLSGRGYVCDFANDKIHLDWMS